MQKERTFDDQLLRELIAIAPQLGRDEGFGQSLIRQGKMYGLTTKQWHWVNVLIGKVKNGGVEKEEERKTSEVGDLQGINKLFDKAKKHLQGPAVVLQLNKHMNIRVRVAKPGTRVPGSLDVMTQDKPRTWFGRILQNGKFQHSPRDATPDGLLELLQKFACDPINVAREHGKLTGYCCFCNKKIGEGEGETSAISAAMGYGPVCAHNFGLPWGEIGINGEIINRLDQYAEEEDNEELLNSVEALEAEIARLKRELVTA